MQLFISRLNSSHGTRVVEIDDYKTVRDLKQKIQDLEGLTPNDQILVSRGMQLKDEKTLLEYGISNLSSIQLLLRLRGGGFKNVVDRPDDPNIIFTIVIDHNGTTKYVDVRQFHLSCGSTNIKEWSKKDIGGAIFYGEKEINYRRMKPGYVYVRAVDDFDSLGSSEGQIHGNLVKSLLNLEPSQLPQDLPTSGFGRKQKDGKWKFNSGTLNQGGLGQNSSSKMNSTEEEKLRDFFKIEKYLGEILEVYLSEALQMWEQGQAQNITKQQLVQHFGDKWPPAIQAPRVQKHDPYTPSSSQLPQRMKIKIIDFQSNSMEPVEVRVERDQLISDLKLQIDRIFGYNLKYPDKQLLLISQNGNQLTSGTISSNNIKRGSMIVIRKKK